MSAPELPAARRLTKKWFLTLPDGLYLASNGHPVQVVRLKADRGALWATFGKQNVGLTVRVMASRTDADRFVGDAARAHADANARPRPARKRARRLRDCVLAWLPGPAGEPVAIHATSTMTRAARAPRSSGLAPAWLTETASVSADQVLVWLDRIDVPRAPVVRLTCALPAGPAVNGSPEATLCYWACALAGNLAIRARGQTAAPLVVLWGPHVPSRGQRWAFYVLGAGGVEVAQELASAFAHGGMHEGLQLETRRPKIPRDGSVAPLLRLGGEVVAMYNRDGREIEAIFEVAMGGGKAPPLEVRIGVVAPEGEGKE